MAVKHSTFTEACKWLFEEANLPYDFQDYGKRMHGRDYAYPQPVYADNKDTVYAYWKRRKISPGTIDALDIQQDKHGNTLFQYYDLNGVLVDVKVRKSAPVPHGEKKCWHLNEGEKVNVLYNMTRVNPELPLIITCGEGDCATAVECGFPNTVSINGGDSNTQWIGECWDWLEQFREIILVHDNDESGRKFIKDVSKRLGEYRLKVVDIPDIITDGNGKTRNVNDLNELLFWCGKQAVADVINEARDAEIQSVVDYTDVKRFDMSDVDGFTSGLVELDDALVNAFKSRQPPQLQLLTEVATRSVAPPWTNTNITRRPRLSLTTVTEAGAISPSTSRPTTT
jgi:twinkle protein